MTSAGRRGRMAGLIAVLALIGAVMLLLNVHTPLMMDDYDYSFSWSTGERLAGLSDIAASQAAHYRLWGGRSVVHALAQLFLYLGKPVFNIANTLMYLLLLLEIAMLARPKGARLSCATVLAAHAALFLFVPFFGTVFLWLDGACNYLWGTALALVPLLIAVSEREGGFFDGGFSRGVLAIVPCFLAGWTNENTACGVLAVCLLLLLWDKLRGRRIRPWRIAAALAQLAGVLVMLLAPGNFARASEGASRSLVFELAYRFGVVTLCVARYAHWALALSAVLLAWKRKLPANVERLCLLVVCALLCAYALVGSPQISDRSFTAVIVLAVSALLLLCREYMPGAAADRNAVCAALLLLTVAGGGAALDRVCAHEQAWLAQVERMQAAADAGESEVTISSVPSDSRFTMDITLESDSSAWPNSTLGKYYGVAVRGQ